MQFRLKDVAIRIRVSIRDDRELFAEEIII
jgi:hypothetical protein